ncbi:N-acyl amino acid synthase FeeM domain-containing protein [Pelagibacterium halotolerans]|uniref:N-acyl amino acid synthase FeeM domain-containing protein n=1 Tax=Pelagibacterium halotolerans TaxID=531813 RepID=UPI00384E3780
MRTQQTADRRQVTTSRFATTLMDILDRVEYRRVRLDEELDPVYRLRYDAYRREDFIPANNEHVARDDLDLVPNAMCYGVYIDGQLVSSLRLHHLTAEHRYSPSMTAYADILHPKLDAGMHFVDPSRFTADRDAALAYPALPFLTIRLAAMACEYFKPDYCLSSIREEHAAFYKRVFGSVEWEGVRYLGGGLKFPVRLYAAKYSEIRDRVADRFPFFMSTPEERDALFAPGSEANYVAAIHPTARKAAIAEHRFAPTEAAE